ncbi:hypothetical protein NDU88_004577 [Pleurodeles waltl]|uniref:Uncharacterized protein n=1 Tax=Pleurodeles waltl TaxID=8319 RepID=A0AAV7VK96_PLEWA|nr:hypothetical protein NDU88_004577 [Pleurodeles waltl]
MGGHPPLEQEDGRGPAGDGLPMWEGCPSHHDPPDVPDPGGGVSRVGWALEGITVATRGARLSRSQPSTSATTSPGTVGPAVTRFWSAPSSRAASVPRSEAKDISPPPKQKMWPTSRRENAKTPATKGSARTTGGSGKTAAPPSKMEKDPKKKGKSTSLPTCMMDKTATATCTTATGTTTSTQDTEPFTCTTDTVPFSSTKVSEPANSTAVQDTAVQDTAVSCKVSEPPTITAAQDTATSTEVSEPPTTTAAYDTVASTKVNEPPTSTAAHDTVASTEVSEPLPAPLPNEHRKHRHY